jgi:hypothetical protein
MSPEIARKMVKPFQQISPPERFEEHLTPQELSLLGLLAQGDSYARAAVSIPWAITSAPSMTSSKPIPNPKSSVTHKYAIPPEVKESYGLSRNNIFSLCCRRPKTS